MRKRNTIGNIERILNEKTTLDPISNCWLYGDKNEHPKIMLDDAYVYVHRISAKLFLEFDLSSDLQVNVQIKIAGIQIIFISEPKPRIISIPP
jgi:hypothetical protein